MGRTDSRLAANVGDDGFAEAMWRCEAFADLGADVVYFEGPDSVLEMKVLNRRIRETPTMLAQVEKPGREILTASQCADLGYDAVLFGLTLLSASTAAVEKCLRVMSGGRAGEHPTARPPQRRPARPPALDEAVRSSESGSGVIDGGGGGAGGAGGGTGMLMPFDELYDVVGFTGHYKLEEKFKPEKFIPEVEKEKSTRTSTDTAES